MKISIQYKLFAAILAASLSVVIGMTIVVQHSLDKGFLEYINIEEKEELGRFAEQLEQYYSEYKSWKKLEGNPLEVLKLHALNVFQGKKSHHYRDVSFESNPPKWLIDGLSQKPRRHPIQRTVIVDENGDIFFGLKLQDELPKLHPLHYQGKQVGAIGIYPPDRILEANQTLFVKRQKSFTITACTIATLSTIIISMLLAYHLTKPIRGLSVAARKLTDGDYSIRVHSCSRDEIEQLASDFNQLAQVLEENARQRKQWVSDIAHELRTPLTTLKSQIEALQDGIRKPDQRTYTILGEGVARLERLVNDLYDLTRTEQGIFTMNRSELDLQKLAALEITTYQEEAEEAGLTLKLIGENNKATVYGDSQRLQQLIGNLLTNSIRYTDSGGCIEVRVITTGRTVELMVDDSAPGVPDESLPLLFNRLYRVEGSRNRALGGSGLGLAICRQIVLAHKGNISTSHSTLGGLQVRVTIPVGSKKTKAKTINSTNVQEL